MTTTSTFDRLRVVLVGTRNPLNLGAAARAMSNFGFTHLRAVNPYEASFQEARSAVGASHILRKTRVFDSLPDAVADCAVVVGTTAGRRRDLQHDLDPLPAAAIKIRAELASGPVALVFGSEKTGLSNEAFSHCHRLLRVPTSEANPSMNLGHAVAVCLYEIARAGREAIRTPKIKPARAGDLERITTLLFDLLAAIGYLKRPTGEAREKVRRMVLRLELSAADATLWLGILRQIAWKLHHPPREQS